MTHFADRLASASRAKRNSLCVGLDPRWESLPEEIRHRHAPDSLGAVARAYEEFCSRVIDIVAPLTPVVKPQSAFFEACGPEGMTALQRVLTKARQRGLITILDGKRNDIASTASAYADASLDGVRFAESQEGRELRVESREPALDSPLSALRTWLHPVWDADALTVNPYLGRDAVEPFLESARRSGRGIFVLVRTSNPGAGQFQDLLCEEPIVKSGEARAGSSLSALHSPLSPLASPLYVHVAEAVGKWSRENLGQCGLGDVGAVVGATKSRESRVESGELRVPSAENRESP
jgi:orotidine-5'-phosphate decarboxylase